MFAMFRSKPPVPKVTVFAEIYPPGWPLTLIFSQNWLALLVGTLLAVFLVHRVIRRLRIRRSFTRLRAAGQLLTSTLVRSSVSPAPHAWFEESARNLPGPVSCCVCANDIDKGREKSSTVGSSLSLGGTPPSDVVAEILASGTPGSSLSALGSRSGPGTAESGHGEGQPTANGDASRDFISPGAGVSYTGSGIERCMVCGVTAHRDCSLVARLDCKQVSIPSAAARRGLVHHWVESNYQRIIEDQPDEELTCCICEEEIRPGFSSGKPVWRCVWCQRLVHVSCRDPGLHILEYQHGLHGLWDIVGSNMSSAPAYLEAPPADEGLCDLGINRRAIVSPLCVKSAEAAGQGRGSSVGEGMRELLSSWTQGANEIASSVTKSIRKRARRRPRKRAMSNLNIAESASAGNIEGEEQSNATVDERGPQKTPVPAL